MANPTRPASPLLARLLGLYLLLALALPLLKLAHVGPVARWSWWGVSSLLWGPWALSALGWGIYFWNLRRRRR